MLAVEKIKEHYKSQSFESPSLYVVLGSGLAPAFDEIGSPAGWIEKQSLSFKDIPGLVGAAAPGHKGMLRYFQHEKTKKVLAFQVGRLHGYEGHDPSLVVRPLTLAFEAGCKTFILTNAAGGLNPKFKAGNVMVIEDQVNLTGKNPLYGPNPVDSSGKAFGPRFPDMTGAFDKKLNASLKKCLQAKKLKTVSGIYLGLLGPTFETPAEVKLYSKWGMGSVGMSTVWETIALRHAGATVGGLSLIANPGAGLVKGHVLTHEEVEREAKKVSRRMVEALFDAAKENFKK